MTEATPSSHLFFNIDPEEETLLNSPEVDLMKSVKPPPELCFSELTSDSFKFWCLRWNSFKSLSGLCHKRQETVYQMFSTLISFETHQTIQLLQLAPAEEKDVDKILEKLATRLDGGVNVHVERYSLHQIVQGNRTFDEFLECLSKCIEKCAYKSCCGTADASGVLRNTCKDLILLSHVIILGISDAIG